MATIRIKRGNFANLPELVEGELAFCWDTQELWIGTPAGNFKVACGCGPDPELPDAGLSTIVAAPTLVAADGVAETAITVTVRNAAGDPLSGKTVEVLADAGDAVVAPTSEVTDGAGVAVFAAVNDTIESGITFTAAIPADVVTVGPSNAVNFYDELLSDAGESTIVVAPTSQIADGVQTVTITVTVRNAGGGPLSGKTVTAAADLGDAVVLPSSDDTDGAGVAVFAATNVTIESGITFTASVAADSVSIGPSDPVDWTEENPPWADLLVEGVYDDACIDCLVMNNAFVIHLDGATPEFATECSSTQLARWITYGDATFRWVVLIFHGGTEVAKYEADITAWDEVSPLTLDLISNTSDCGMPATILLTPVP